MDKELEKELEEVVKEMLLPENRQKLLLGILLGMNMVSATSTHAGKKLEAIYPNKKTPNFDEPLLSNDVKTLIELTEVKLKDVERIVNVNYSFVNEKSPD